jgi:hypothetical protein
MLAYCLLYIAFNNTKDDNAILYARIPENWAARSGTWLRSVFRK